MIITEAYFNNIREEILKELDLAKETIYVAVAWFTEPHLFNKLLEKQKDGVKVSLVITNDEINHQSSIDYTKLKSLGGYFLFYSGVLMHNKFCVIDKRIVITGSFNWTNKATNQNHENITVTQNDFDLAYKFIQQFKQLTGEVIQEQEVSVDFSKIIKRLTIIKDLIVLGDDEDVVYQSKRLKKDEVDVEVEQIISFIDEGKFDKVVTSIEQFINSKTRIVTYIDPHIAALQLEIRNLEFRILSIDELIDEKKRIIYTFTTKYYEVLGEIISQILKIKERYSFFEKDKTKYHKQDYEYAKSNQETFHRDKKSIENKPAKELSEIEQKQLKLLYREAAMICHPDKLPEELKEKGAEKFRELQDAYKQDDITKVAEIVNDLRVGDWSSVKKIDIDDLNLLLKKKEQLIKKLDERIAEFDNVVNCEMYKCAIEAQDDINAYLYEVKVKMDEQLIFWKEKLKHKEEENKIASDLGLL